MLFRSPKSNANRRRDRCTARCRDDSPPTSAIHRVIASGPNVAFSVTGNLLMSPSVAAFQPQFSAAIVEWQQFCVTTPRQLRERACSFVATPSRASSGGCVTHDAILAWPLHRFHQTNVRGRASINYISRPAVPSVAKSLCTAHVHRAVRFA